ncbi:MAG: delta-60 repeat domain-containing protein [Nitrospira sp.]
MSGFTEGAYKLPHEERSDGNLGRTSLPINKSGQSVGTSIGRDAAKGLEVQSSWLFTSHGLFFLNRLSVSAGKKAELARSVVVQSDGKIVFAGPMEHDTAATGDSAPDRDIAIARFDNTGQLDQTFGTNGITRLDPSTEAVSGEAFRGDTA